METKAPGSTNSRLAIVISLEPPPLRPPGGSDPFDPYMLDRNPIDSPGPIHLSASWAHVCKAQRESTNCTSGLPTAKRLDGSIRLDRPVNTALGQLKAWGDGRAARAGRIFHPDLLADVHPGPLGSDGFGKGRECWSAILTDLDLV